MSLGECSGYQIEVNRLIIVDAPAVAGARYAPTGVTVGFLEVVIVGVIIVVHRVPRYVAGTSRVHNG